MCFKNTELFAALVMVLLLQLVVDVDSQKSPQIMRRLLPLLRSLFWGGACVCVGGGGGGGVAFVCLSVCWLS